MKEANLSGIGHLEEAFAIVLAAAAMWLFVGLAVSERRHEFATMAAVGASKRCCTKRKSCNQATSHLRLRTIADHRFPRVLGFGRRTFRFHHRPLIILASISARAIHNGMCIEALDGVAGRAARRAGH